MNTRRLCAGLVAALLSLMVAICGAPAASNAYAADGAASSAGGEYALSISHAKAGATFSVFRVAEVADSGALDSWTPEASALFAQAGKAAPVLYEGAAAAEWRDLAGQLEGLIRAAGLEADATLVADASGAASLEGLPQGLYLVLGDTCEADGARYAFSPSLVSLPAYDADTGERLGSAAIEPKFETEPVDAEPAETDPGEAEEQQTTTVVYAGSPATGDGTPIAAIALIAVAAAAVLAATVAARRRGR